jgi:hypothetical protein
LGCTVIIKDTDLEFPSGLNQVVEGIEDCIVAFGPVEFIRTVTGHMIANNMYIPEYKRYLVRNEISFLSFQAMPMVPFGFLLNLAVKHIGKPEAKLTRSKSDALLEEINYKSKLLGTIADARAYGIWELHFQNEDTLLNTIRSIGLYDAIFSFPSADIGDIIAYMEHLFYWQDNAVFRARYGFGKDEILQITRAVDLIAPDNGPCIIYVSAIRKIVNHIDTEVITNILTELSHQQGTINPNYVLTEHYDQINFGQRPLIQLGHTKFLLCDKSWCATAFYEALAAMIRTFDSNKNESNIQIGYALEEFVRSRFREKGITYHHGNYADPGAAKGEADGIIETEKAIVLLEIKKKVLTRRSKAGSTVSLVIDLAGSLLEAQVQAGRTEILLREQGYITLESQTILSKILFNGREIERVTLSQWDFGSFQDRGIVNNFLTILANHEYTLLKEDNESDVAAFKKMQKLRKEHETQAVKLHKLDPRFDHYPFFSTWFLSVPQILTILKYANNNEEFYKVLSSTKGVTMSSMNFYFEFLYSYIRSPNRN